MNVRIIVKKNILMVVCLLVSMIIFGCASDVNDQETTVTEGEEMTEEEEVIEASSDEPTRETIRIVSNEFPPYVYEEGPDEGFYSELIKEAFDRQGIEVNIEFYPWNRGVELVRAGQAFATFPWIATAERSRVDQFSNNYYYTRDVIVYLKDDLVVADDFENVIELKKYSLGTVSGYYYINQLESLGFELDSSDTETEILTKLYNGRHDAIIISEISFERLVKSLYPDERDKFEIMKSPFRETYFALRVSKSYKDSDRYVRLFNEELLGMINDGSYQALLEKYGLPDSDIEKILKQYKVEKLVIGLEDYAPSEYVDGEGNIVGIGIDLVKEAILRLGYSSDNFEFVVTPWSRLMEMGKLGEVDVLLDAFYTEGRSETFDYSDQVYAHYEFYFIALDKNKQSFDGRLFSKPVKTLGVVRGYQYSDEINELLEQHQLAIDEVGTPDELMEGLLNGRYDVIIETDIFAKFYLKEHSVEEKITLLWKPLDLMESFMMYPKINKMDTWRESIDKEIKNILNDGTYDNILNYYLE